MDPLHIVLLLVAGAIGGFVSGLIGVGGGTIFGPVLFYFFRATGVAPEVLTPLTLGSSLFCALAASASGTVRQVQLGAVRPRIALVTGTVAALTVAVMTAFVTTQPWYEARVFQVVLAAMLLVVVWRMVADNRKPEPAGPEPTPRLGVLVTTGVEAGALASAAGVGGGILMVPIFNQVLKLPLKVAVGTSTATIVIICAVAVVSYVVTGLGAPVPPTALGYVDLGHALVLAVPTLITARWGVQAVHRVNVRVVRLCFAAFAVFVAGNLLWDAWQG